jgi:uncharacterized protein (TIGR02118 family)
MDGETAMVKLTVLYGHPVDPVAFEQYYEQTHMPTAGKIAGVRRFELAKPLGMPDGSAPPYYRMAELYFDDAPHMQSVLETPEAQATVADIPNFATGGVTMFVSDVLAVASS